ncbi:hypothetical protein A7X88_00175 [Stenotrophomonas maltophilia]|uniref:hypothetical protein n=1 Tax=Stenotrophomonas maltophilia TaxID=40324 RepID=UPI000DA99ECE|nr:hypothetical protein [Stenotrophomonas maltophilia]PZT29720.1 hypothetical protein A7X88_00175 [Stenotrophomonas maltophilia]
MSEAIAEVLQRLEACETSMEAHRGYLKAFEYGLRAVVITHPRPEELGRVWTQLLPGIAEKHSGDGGAIYTAALQQALALLTDQIVAPI